METVIWTSYRHSILVGRQMSIYLCVEMTGEGKQQAPKK